MLGYQKRIKVETKVLITGSEGYIGKVLSKMLTTNGYSVAGVDSCIFPVNTRCDGGNVLTKIKRKDVRAITKSELEGFYAVIHLAALSNDPSCELQPHLTRKVNIYPSIELAYLCREAGVKRFVFSSSCSVYGSNRGNNTLFDENSPLSPLSLYSEAKLVVESVLKQLSDDNFSPVILRNATVYGSSPRMRLDLVINKMLLSAITTGMIEVIGGSDTVRPLVNIQDVAKAFCSILGAKKEAIHNQTFNVGLTSENYTLDEMAKEIKRLIGGGIEIIHRKNGYDRRSFRVDFSKYNERFPGILNIALRDGLRELMSCYIDNDFDANTLDDPSFYNIRYIQSKNEFSTIAL